MLDTNKPDWIRGKVSWSDELKEVRETLAELDLHTVCEEASCPNVGECWKERHATFIILGDICTRGCLFCDVTSGSPESADPGEPERIARAVERLGIKYAVITSVTRDDLEDKGAEHFVRTVKAIRKRTPNTVVELLIPDMDADQDLLLKVASSGAKVIGHNIEMPEKLYPAIRPKADYQKSLEVLRKLSHIKEAGNDIIVKSSIMLGLSEEEGDIEACMKDLKGAGVDILYIGQYLNPTKEHWPVDKFYTPEEFVILEQKAIQMGFKSVCSGPMVRTSYHAQRSLQTLLDKIAR